MAEARSASAFVLPDDMKRSLVREAARAPSVHNVQPARWRFESSGDVVLFRAVDRALPVADPSGHDVMASLGASFEGMAIAFSRLGYSLGRPAPEHRASAPGCLPVVRARVTRGAVPDPLARFVELRRCHRGRFAPAGAAELAALATIECAEAHVVTARDEIAAVAAMHDAATWRFESQPDFHAELWSWLRLSRRDPRYWRDGLTAECLALSGLERQVARVLLRPAPFTALTRLGVARRLVAESPQVRSASAVVLFAPRTTDEPFDVGRRFYRLWLQITATGLYAAPMSASADDGAAREALGRRYDMPAERRLANVLRVGAVPARDVPRSPRLPVVELLV